MMQSAQGQTKKAGFSPLFFLRAQKRPDRRGGRAVPAKREMQAARLKLTRKPDEGGGAPNLTAEPQIRPNWAENAARVNLGAS